MAYRRGDFSGCGREREAVTAVLRFAAPRWTPPPRRVFDIDPIKALFWTAVINGVVAVPLMVIMMLMTRRPDIIGGFALSRRRPSGAFGEG
jgi:hypothetical protein